jgi:hypothetical protein
MHVRLFRFRKHTFIRARLFEDCCCFSVVTDDSAGAEDSDVSVLMYTDLYPTATV